MLSESYTISTSQTLVTTAKRYRSSTRRVHANTAGWVLIFAHGAGMYKERFEIVLNRLFELDSNKQCGSQIVEGWSIDTPTHGAAAELNESIINQDDFRCTAFDYAGAIAALRTSIFFGDADMQRVVVIGENEGAAAALFTPDFFTADEDLPIENIILINPFTPAPQFSLTEWRHRESARRYLEKGIDPTLIDSFMEYALVRMDTGDIRTRASEKHQSQLRDKKYSSWDSTVFPIGTGVHLILTQDNSDAKSKAASQPFASVTEEKEIPDAIYDILTMAMQDMAERVFGLVKTRDVKL